MWHYQCNSHEGPKPRGCSLATHRRCETEGPGTSPTGARDRPGYNGRPGRAEDPTTLTSYRLNPPISDCPLSESMTAAVTGMGPCMCWPRLDFKQSLANYRMPDAGQALRRIFDEFNSHLREQNLASHDNRIRGRFSPRFSGEHRRSFRSYSAVALGCGTPQNCQCPPASRKKR